MLLKKKGVYGRKTKFGEKNENAHKRQKTIVLRIDDWIPDDFGTANPFPVVKYLRIDLNVEK